MNIETWRSFLLINEVGSIAKAAELSFQSSQGLNYIITTLENELGAALFERHRKGVKLTKFGEAILEDVKNLIETDDEIRRKINYMLQLQTHNLRIGIINSLNIIYGPIIFEYYNNNDLDIHLFIEEFSSPQLNKAIKEGRMDIGFSFDCYPSDSLSKVLLTEEGWCLLCNKNNALAAKTEVNFEDLRGHKIAIANHNYKDFDYITNLCRRRNVNLEIMLAFATGDKSVVSFLEKDIGVMLCATYIARAFLKEHDFCAVPIREDLEIYHSCLLYRHETEIPRNLLELITYIQEQL